MILLKIGRIHGGLIDDGALIMAPFGFNDRRNDLAAIRCFEVAHLELVHVPTGLREEMGSGLVFQHFLC
jgi:hypothetical protein